MIDSSFASLAWRPPAGARTWSRCATACAAATLFFGASTAQAALVLAYDTAFGSESVVHDTSTGLDWLRLNKTLNVSFADVASQLGVGQTFAGWTIPTASFMLSSLGAPNGVVHGDATASGLADAVAMSNLFCAASAACKSSTTHIYTRGLIADTQNVGGIFPQQAFSVGRLLNPESVDFRVSGYDYGDPNESVWLYRVATPVPEPGTLLMAGLGVAVLLARRRRAAVATT